MLGIIPTCSLRSLVYRCVHLFPSNRNETSRRLEFRNLFITKLERAFCYTRRGLTTNSFASLLTACSTSKVLTSYSRRFLLIALIVGLGQAIDVAHRMKPYCCLCAYSRGVLFFVRRRKSYCEVIWSVVWTYYRRRIGISWE